MYIHVSILMIGIQLIVVNCGCLSNPSSPARFEKSFTKILSPNSMKDRIVRHDFHYVNPSSSMTLDLAVARKTCGCTRCDIEQPRLGPGEGTDISLEFQLGYVRIKQSESVYLSTGNEDEEVELSMNVNAYPAIHVNTIRPIILKTSGHHAPGFEVSTYCWAEAEHHTLEVSADPRILQLEVKEARRETADGVRQVTYNIAVMPGDDVRKSAMSGRVKVPIAMRCGDDSLTRVVFVDLPGTIDAVPREVFLTASSNGEGEHSKRVRIVAKSPFVIQRLDCGSGRISAQSEMGDVMSIGHEIEITMTEEALSGKTPRYFQTDVIVQIQSDDGKESQLSIPIFAILKRA